MSQLFSDIEAERAINTIDVDEEGVAVLAGSQHTDTVWYAERMAVNEDEEEMATYRLLRLKPDFTSRMRMRQQPPLGMERSREFDGCRAGVFEVTLSPPLSREERPLSRVQDAYAKQARNQPLYQTRVRSRGQLLRLYREWFVQPVE